MKNTIRLTLGVSLSVFDHRRSISVFKCSENELRNSGIIKMLKQTLSCAQVAASMKTPQYSCFREGSKFLRGKQAATKSHLHFAESSRDPRASKANG